MSSQWKVTRDLLDGVDVSVCSPGWVDGDPSAEVMKFRMLDDDGEVYYSGVAGADCGFGPLDDYGMTNAGCTEIQYFERGVWVRL